MIVLALLLVATVLTTHDSRAALTDEASSAADALPGHVLGVSFADQQLVRGAMNSVVVTVQNNSGATWQPQLLEAVLEITDPIGTVLASAGAADTVQMRPVAPGDMADFTTYLSVPLNLPASAHYRAIVRLDGEIVARSESEQRLRVIDQIEENKVRSPGTEVREPQYLDQVTAGQNVDLVFAMDTSGSMSDEFSALCGTISNVIQDLQGRGINLDYRILGITSTWYCATETVSGVVPGGLVNHEEDWGPATSDLSKSYPWQPGYVRLIVPVSDEAPQNGNYCDTADQDSIMTAIADAKRANVRVSPILGTGYSTCVEQLGQQLADETGGRLFFSTNPGQDIADGIVELVGGVVTRSYISVNPTDVPVAGSATVTVTVRDEENQLVQGHRVRVLSSRGGVDTFSQAVGTTNAQGQFVTSVTSQISGVSVLHATDLTANEPVIGTARIAFGVVANPPSAAPRIVSVESDSILDGLYAQGIGPLPNELKVTVDWRDGAPGNVEFILNDRLLISKDATSSVTSHTVDFGSLRIGPNTLRILARNSVGTEVKTFVIQGWDVPAWVVVAQAVLNPLNQDDYLEIQLQVPGSPLWAGYDANWLFTGHRSTVNLQYASTIRLPLRGGQWYADFTGSLGHNNKTPGRPQKILQSMKLVGHNIENIEGSIILGGIVDRNGLRRTDFALGAGVNFEEFVLLRATLLEMLNAFPPGGTSLYLALKQVPPVEKAVGMIAQATLGITPSIDFKFDMLQQDKLDLAGTFDVNGDLDLTLAILNGTAQVYAGVGIGVEITADDFTDYCFVGVGEGHAGYILNMLLWQESAEYQVELVRKAWGDCGAALFAASPSWTETLISRQPWHIPRGNFGVDYTKFVGGSTTLNGTKSLAGTDTVVAAMSDIVLFGNVYGNAKPSLAWAPDGSQGMIVWTYDDPAKSAGQGLEIASSYYDGTSWSPRINITADTYPDTGARATRLGDGRFMAVWERVNDPALPANAPFDASSWSKTEIMAAIFDPASGTWSVPVKVHGDNSVLDYSPQIAASDNNAAISVWRHNAVNELVGTEADPDEMRFAQWDGTSWSGGTAVGNLAAVGEMDLAYGGTGATLAWSQTITPTGVVTGTQQIFTSTFNGGIWTAPEQQTSGGIDHVSPQAFFTPSGTAAVAWLEDGNIAWRTFPSGPIQISKIPQEADEFRLASNAAGNLVATWLQQDDMFLSLYDWDDNLWSAPVNLTNNLSRETYPNPFLEDTGMLRIGYASTQITEEVRSGSGAGIPYTAKVPGQTDINLLSLEPYNNLTAEAIDVVPDGTGATADVAVTVGNTGHFAASTVDVAVYDGDPGAGGVILGTTSLPDPLAAGTNQTITFTHAIDPTGGVRTFWASVDPADAISEIDEADNVVSMRALGPNTVLDSAMVLYPSGSMVDFEAVTRNYGTAESGPATIAFYMTDTTGAPVVTGKVPALGPGEEATVLTSWDFGSLAAGEHTVIGVVNDGEADFAEIELDDNAYAFTLTVAADLVVDPLYFTSDVASDGSVKMEATVFNFGEVAANNVPVVFYDASSTPLTEVGSTTVTSVPAGDAVTVDVSWLAPPNQFSLIVVADPDSTILESRRDNNAASLVPGFQLIAQPDDVVVPPGATVTINVDVRSIGGYVDPVFLEALDLPVGGTGVLTPETVTPAGSSTLEIAVPMDAAEAVYPVRVVGTSGTLISTATLMLEVSTLAAPHILEIADEPQNGAYTVRWSSVNEATGYQLEEQFNGGIWTHVYTGPDTEFSLSGKEPGNWCYRVRTLKDSARSIWSDTECKTVSAVLPAPKLMNIDNNDGDGDYSVQWTNVGGAKSYSLQERLNGGTWATIFSGTDTGVQRVGQAPGSWCYRVRVFDDGGVGSGWSDVKCTTVEPPPTAPEIDVRWADNDQSIGDNDMSPSSSDGTDFGTISLADNGVTHSFRIHNIGDAALSLTDNPRVQLSGCAGFAVVAQPGSSVAPGTSQTFAVRFDPVTPGVCGATVTIANDDETENPYNFVIRGTGEAAAGLPAPVLYEIANQDSDGDYTVRWTAVANASAYALHEKQDEGLWTLVYGGAGTSTELNGRNEGMWCYRVSASNIDGSSAWSGSKCTIVATQSSGNRVLLPLIKRAE